MALNLTCDGPFCKNSFIYIAFFALLLVWPGICYAKDTEVTRLQTRVAKRLTMEAIEAIEDKNWDVARDKVAESRDPLANKIYHWYLLMNTEKKDWTNQLFIRLSHFIRQNSDWPGVRKMIVRAEGVMPEDLANQEVLAWYDEFPPQTSYGMGRYMDALVIEGKRERAQEFLANWWASTLVSRDQQRKIFQKYGGYLTLDAHKKRFDALLYNKHYDSALGIAGVLGSGYKALAEARIALAKNRSSGLADLINNVPEYLQDDPGLLYERLRWRRKRNLDDGALEILQKAPEAKDVYNKKDWWTERHIMIRRLLEEKQFEKAFILADNHIQEDGFAFAQAEWLAGWLALRFVDKPERAYERFTALHQKVTTPVSKARASYWAGRAMLEIGDQALARDWFDKAAEFNTTYYGQLAAIALGKQSKSLKESLPRISLSDKSSFEKNELMQAAGLFAELGLSSLSFDFINSFLKGQGTPSAYRYAAENLADKGDYHGALKVSKMATKQELFLTKQSFPTITKQLKDINFVEWALIHALIRQESMFNPNASSHAGAKGLMQLMPATARGVAKKHNMKYSAAWLTQKPHYNMFLGASYIHELLGRFDNDYVLSIASYNAGPGRVNSWLRLFGDPRDPKIDVIDWIELIPVYETRNYVQRVMEGVFVYRLRLKNIQMQPDQGVYDAFNIRTVR